MVIVVYYAEYIISTNTAFTLWLLERRITYTINLCSYVLTEHHGKIEPNRFPLNHFFFQFLHLSSINKLFLFVHHNIVPVIGVFGCLKRISRKDKILISNVIRHGILTKAMLN